MKILVVIGHQNQQSYCQAIAQKAIGEMKSLGHEVIFHDLYAEGFDPVLTQEELDADKPPQEVQSYIDRAFGLRRNYDRPSELVGRTPGDAARLGRPGFSSGRCL